MGASDAPAAPPASSGGGGGPAGGGPAVDSLLLSIPSAELHQVCQGQERLLAQGPLTFTVVERAPSPTPKPQLFAQAAPAPAPPATQPLAGGKLYPGVIPPTKSQLYPYPEVYQPADSDSDDGSSRGSITTIVASVGPTSWEVLPASQTLKVGELTFIFSTAQPDVFYSVTLAADTDIEAVGMLEAVLESVTIYKESQKLLTSPEAQAGEAALADSAYKSSLARGVERWSKTLATGLLASATYATSGIAKGASKLKPATPTANPITISPGLKKRFSQTARAAGYAAKAVNGAVSGLAWAGAKVAGGVLWLAGAKRKPKEGRDPSALKEVSQAGLLGFTEVWDSMEEAGKVVLLAARDSTADVVRQRYGPDAAEVGVHAMNAAGHTTDAVLAARKLGVKTVAKAAAKRTAKGVIGNWAGLQPDGSRPGSSSSSGTSGSGIAAPSAMGGAVMMQGSKP